ncbi:hypothetical protein [Aquipuribacter hungaricus]|uniref:Uncharacterized protein n=1 Tax=Aquipuribacter hungaricus TaxID=545624 RepID=A0ABV7WJ61_9MICO
MTSADPLAGRPAGHLVGRSAGGPDGDRRTRPRALRAVEVIDMDERADERATAEVARLFEIVGREGEAIGQLDGCVSLLRDVQQAKAELGRLTPTQLRAGLRYRQALLRADTA